MAAVTPRLSALWTDESRRSSYFPVANMDDGAPDDLEAGPDAEHDPRTALDRTIDRIGMGSYQWILLSLCGLGWLADNMWMQAIAIALPRVQRHYSISDGYIGVLSSSVFLGMMIGALAWGACSDLMGRTTAFNATLILTAVFGILAGFTTSFPSSALHYSFWALPLGSMPTDGTLLLEYMPKGKQYLLTALSVFFSIGSVVSAVIALLVIPQNSCLSDSAPCDVDAENRGWKYLLIILGGITAAMFIARIVLFRLYESPRFLVNAGRHQEALNTLQMISRYNGSELSLRLGDVDDRPRAPTVPLSEEHAPFLADAPDSPKEDTVIFDVDSQLPLNSADGRRYDSTSNSGTPLDAAPRSAPLDPDSIDAALSEAAVHEDDVEVLSPRRARPRRSPTHASRRSLVSRASFYEVEKRVGWTLPDVIRRPFLAWVDRISLVLTPQWFRTTILMWLVWCFMALAYTMFNIFLPKILETRGGSDAAEPQTLEGSLWAVVFFTVGGCPGAVLGAWLVETRLGRKHSLSGSTLVTAACCAVFTQVESAWAIQASTMAISLSVTTMWAVLYGWTPEIFGTEVRGTACGIASALSRIGGMIAPIVGGQLLSINRSLPVYVSVVTFAAAGVVVMFIDPPEVEGGGGDVGLVH